MMFPYLGAKTSKAANTLSRSDAPPHSILPRPPNMSNLLSSASITLLTLAVVATTYAEVTLPLLRG